MCSENGIKPCLTPSMKNISPIITIRMPMAIDSASRTSERSNRVRKAASISASGVTARNCSKKRTEK